MRYVPLYPTACDITEYPGHPEYHLALLVQKNDPAGVEVSREFREQIRDALNEALSADVYALEEEED